jgi:CRP-like cAMP-binding protein
MGNNDEVVVSVLGGLGLFAGLDFQTLKELSVLFEAKIYNKDEIIFHEDSVGNSMMVITSGKVRVSQKPDPNTEETLIVLNEGDVFGEMALIEDLPRSATTIAHTDAVILEISRTSFLNFIHKNCESGVKILLELSRILSSRLRETDNKIKAFVNLTKWL